MSEEPEKKSNHGFLKFIGAIALAVMLILCTIMVVNCVNDTNRYNPGSSSSNSSSSGNSDNSGNSGNSGNSNNSTPQLFSRNAKNNDIYVEFLDDISLSMKYRIKPNVDIKNLQLTFSYSDKSGTIIATKVKNVGNVSEGVQFDISISLSEFSFSEIWNITRQSVAVTSGTVSYLR